ncbi:MAG: DUF3034 family protein [Rhodospirillaceae bacterium]|nr:DUF3034 family protein [Rhodospirillaceae bacterium]
MRFFALALPIFLSQGAAAQLQAPPVTTDRPFGGKLVLTGGVTQVEGVAGGGLTPWALIGGYGTRDQVGGNGYYTHVRSQDFHLQSYGAMLGLYDRVEISVAQQRFDTEDVGAALGLGKGFTFRQDIVGLKVKVAGDAVLEQDQLLPQIAVGAQYKRNNREAVVKSLGATHDDGVDFYASATKLFLAESVLVNATVRLTKANQLGILGFGGDRSTSYKPMLEGSAALLLSRNWAVGAEYRSKPNNLKIAREQDWWDAFLVWAPTKNLSVTAAYVDLGNIVIRDNQRAAYISLQFGF